MSPTKAVGKLLKPVILFLSIALLWGATLISCRPDSTSAHRISEVDSLIDSHVQKLDSFFAQKFPANEPGGAILVISGDSVLFSRGYGLSNISTQEKVTSKTLFNLGSVSKTFVSNSILILQAQGKLSVEDSLLKYFSDFKNRDIARKVKIKHLLTHTSGLPDIRFPSQDSVFYLTAKDKENWAPIMRATKLNFEPGSQFEYSNPAFNALALIIENLSGEKWQAFVSRNILLPSGMKTSTITDGSHPQAGVAHAYIKVGETWLEKDYGEEPTFAAAGNGGVWSSIEELALYEKALANYIFLDSALQKEATTVKVFTNWKGKESPAVGWSWFIGRTADGQKTIGHTGSQGGFRANYLSIPEKRVLIVMLSATPRPLEEYTNWVLEYLKTGKYVALPSWE